VQLTDWLNLLTPFLVLAATWFIGQRILNSWDIRKKRQELDIAAATQFQQLYGEAKEIARLWRFIADQQEPPVLGSTDLHWQLLTRATAVEGKFEAVVIKLATERHLTKEQIRSVGLFRRSCYELRESIRDKRLPTMGYGGGYTLFNNLAVEITCLLNTNSPTNVLELSIARQNLKEIAKIGSESLHRAIEEIEKEDPDSRRLGVPRTRKSRI